MVDTKKATPLEGSPSNSNLQRHGNTGTNDATNLKEAALALADSFGWRIVPLHGITEDGSCDCKDSGCKSPGKHPRTKHGAKEATTDPDKIAFWWGTWPNSNIGVATGKESGIFVVDYDKNKSGDDRLCGMESFNQDSAKFPEVANTLQIRSGSGGRHAVFQYPKGVQIGCRNKINASHVDIRGDGGYIIAPPSLHQSGNPYQWAQSGAILEASADALAHWTLTGREQDDQGGNDWEKAHDETIDTRELQKINEALSHIRALGDDWLKAGMALHDRFNGSPEGFHIWRQWSRTAPGYENEPAADHWKRWLSFGNYKGAPTTLATIYERAAGSGWAWVPPEGEELVIFDVPTTPSAIRASSATHELFALKDHFEGYNREFDYLVKSYLPAPSFGVIYGASGSYKSFHALNWAVHIALGREWNGRRVTQAPVLYIAGEGGLGVPRRIKALADEYNNGEPIGGLYRLDHAIAAGDPKHIDRLIETVKRKAAEIEQPFGLIVLDTLARCFSGDENKAEDMGRFVTACDRLKTEAGATVLVVHHSGVNEERARGSTSLRAAADFEYQIKRAETGHPAIVLKSTKAKDDREAPPQIFHLTERHLYTDSDGDPVTSLVCSDIGEAAPEEAPRKEASDLSPREQTLWQAVRSRTATGESTAIAVIRDDLKKTANNPENVRKNFRNWLNGCIDKGFIVMDGEELKPADPNE